MNLAQCSMVEERPQGVEDAGCQPLARGQVEGNPGSCSSESAHTTPGLWPQRSGGLLERPHQRLDLGRRGSDITRHNPNSDLIASRKAE